MDDADPTDPEIRRRILAVRSAVRLKDGRPNDGRCGHVSEALEAEFGWQRRCGYLLLLDSLISWVHCWNVRDDGSIVDATADQFQDQWLGGDVITIRLGDPYHDHYRLRAPEWLITIDPSGPMLHCRSGGETQLIIGDDPDRPWFGLARSFVLMLTGCTVHDQVIDLAARVLRARADAPDPIPSAELLHPLVIQSVRLSKPWIAPEFRDPV